MQEDIYQEFIIELYKNPRNFGRMKDADLTARLHNTSCGDLVELFIKLKDSRVSEAKYYGRGCAISQASASLFTGTLIGKSIEELKALDKTIILGLLKIDLSRNPSRMKCALLPLDALRRAIEEKYGKKDKVKKEKER